MFSKISSSLTLVLIMESQYHGDDDGNHQDSQIDETDGYQYDKLRIGHIRLMKLQPAVGIDEPIIGDLYQVQLGNHRKYTALSYSWAMDATGDDSLNRTVLIHGKQLHVTQNLHDCLRRLRNTTAVVRVWADAICINQEKENERAAQVSIMAGIYQNAFKTVLWLGEGTSEEVDLETFQLLGRMQQVAGLKHDEFAAVQALLHTGDGSICRYERGISCPCGGFSTSARPVAPTSSVDPALESPLSKSPHLIDLGIRRLRAAQAFLSRRYWTRRWIIQEITSSMNSWLHWRHFKLSARSFGGLHGTVHAIYYAATVFYRAVRDVEIFTGGTSSQSIDKLIFSMRDSTRKIGMLFQSIDTHLSPPSMMLLLELFHPSECSDPRDRLYSLVSLLQDCEIKPNYHLQTTDVFIKFATQTLQQGHATWLFANLYHPRYFDDDIQRRLLSWVPDLREPLIGRLNSVTPFDRSHASIGPYMYHLHPDSTMTLLLWYMGFIGADIDKERNDFSLIRGSFKAGKRRSSAEVLRLHLGRTKEDKSIEVRTQLMMPNDVLCSYSMDPPVHKGRGYSPGLSSEPRKFLLLLRRQGRKPDTWRIIQSMDGSRLYQILDSFIFQVEIAELRSMTVRIV